jgi:DNA-binding CsgD family transcriptional regulator
LNVLEKYPTPHKRWRSYLSFKKNIDPWMHDWVQAMDTLSLSEQEKIFCAISLIYPHMTDVEIADFICYSKDGIRVFKNRILKKLGVTSSNFVDFLRKLSVSK